MFDADLQSRFARNATLAFIEGAEALLAASRAWQDAVQASMSDAGAHRPPAPRTSPMPVEAYAAWAWAFDFWRPAPTLGSAFDQMWTGMSAMNSANAWQAFRAPPTWMATPDFAMSPFAMSPFAMSPFALPAAANDAFRTTADPAAFWSSMISAYWTLPAMSWSLYQGPMTMMLVGAGLPFAVAAPTARASAAALEAADAMRLQTIKTFSSFRTDGGHASAQ